MLGILLRNLYEQVCYVHCVVLFNVIFKCMRMDIMYEGGADLFEDDKMISPHYMYYSRKNNRMKMFLV